MEKKPGRRSKRENGGVLKILTCSGALSSREYLSERVSMSVTRHCRHHVIMRVSPLLCRNRFLVEQT